MNELNALADLIRGWAQARLIIPNGRADGQWLKGFSELGELADGMAKSNRALIKDAIGDVFVCLVTHTSLAHITFVPLKNSGDRQADPLENFISLSQRFLSLKTVDSASARQIACTLVVSYLSYIAQAYSLTLEECVEFAWNTIKDRKGTTTPEGVFIKEE